MTEELPETKGWWATIMDWAEYIWSIYSVAIERQPNSVAVLWPVSLAAVWWWL